MRDFLCPRCGQRLAFENSRCLGCNGELRYSPDDRGFIVVFDDVLDCANRVLARCNWTAPGPSHLCRSCRLTRTRPADDDTVGLAAFADAEGAKRRMLVQLHELGLPVVGRDADPVQGLCFDLLSSEHRPVITGHASGAITLDLAEGDDVHRTQLRVSMDEPYRTLLGHFRHEVGHYYYLVLVRSPEQRAAFTELFGDPDASYPDALARHYSQGAPPDWGREHVSSYATMHPAEDWAETFAHYLHVRGTLDTAAAFGMAPAGATMDQALPGDSGFDRLIQLWLPLSWALNMVNRSMGRSDVYPFVLSPPVLAKMRLVHRLVGAARS